MDLVHPPSKFVDFREGLLRFFQIIKKIVYEGGHRTLEVGVFYDVPIDFPSIKQEKGGINHS